MKEIHVPAGISAAGTAALALAFGLAAPACAQQPAASSGVTFSGSGRAAPPPATIYEDAASGERFVLQQQGRDAFAKFLDTGEVVALKGVQAQRGDTYYKNDAGETLFRQTEQGNITTYLDNKNGMPAEVVGYTSFANPPMPASLDQRRKEAASKLIKLAGHDVTIFGTAEFANHEAWAADALSNVVIGVERANGLVGRIAAKLEKVRLVRSKAATVSFKDGELLLGVNPDEGYGGRPSSEAIANALTAARSSG